MDPPLACLTHHQWVAEQLRLQHTHMHQRSRPQRVQPYTDNYTSQRSRAFALANQPEEFVAVAEDARA